MGKHKKAKAQLPAKVKAAEGEWRPGPYVLDDGWLPAGTAVNFWQLGQNVVSERGGSTSAIVRACIAAYSETTAMCPGTHWRQRKDGGRDRVDTSALSRIIVQPNDYQSISDFLLGMTRSLYADGAAYALAVRNDRNEISELHPMRSSMSRPLVSADGEIFYELGGNDIVERRFGYNMVVPARDVLHIRLECPRHPLIGVTPLLAAMLEVSAGDAMMRQQLQFFINQAKPSIGLSTDQVLDRTQTDTLRAMWNDQTRGPNAGGTPILTAGLKPVFFDRSSADSQLADMLKISAQNVALAFRVPLQVLGIGQAAVTSTETLMGSWKSTGLGFCLNHIEEAFGRLFRLRGYPAEYLELSTDILMRSAFKDRIEALARGVQGGIFAPNEARNSEDLGSVPDGDEPRVQQQMVPLSYGAALDPTAPAPAPPSAPANPPADAPADPADTGDQTDSGANDASKHVTGDILARIHAHADRLH